MLSNFAEGDYVPKGTKLSPRPKERKSFLFSAPPRYTVLFGMLKNPDFSLGCGAREAPRVFPLDFCSSQDVWNTAATRMVSVDRQGFNLSLA